jgi:hypothetical protein
MLAAAQALDPNTFASFFALNGVLQIDEVAHVVGRANIAQFYTAAWFNIATMRVQVLSSALGTWEGGILQSIELVFTPTFKDGSTFSTRASIVLRFDNACILQDLRQFDAQRATAQPIQPTQAPTATPTVTPIVRNVPPAVASNTKNLTNAVAPANVFRTGG